MALCKEDNLDDATKVKKATATDVSFIISCKKSKNLKTRTLTKSYFNNLLKSQTFFKSNNWFQKIYKLQEVYSKSINRHTLNKDRYSFVSTVICSFIINHIISQ